MPLVCNIIACIITGKAPTSMGEKSEDLPSHCLFIVVHAAFGPWQSKMMQTPGSVHSLKVKFTDSRCRLFMSLDP